MSKILTFKKEYISYVFVVFVGLLMSALAANASTTISTNVVTGGKVGIASTTPGYPLSSVGAAYFDGGTVTASVFIATSSISSAGTLSVTGVSTLTGNVGIASTTPGYALSVGGSAMFDGGVATAKSFVATSSISSAGTLAVTGVTTLTGNLGVASTTPGYALSVGGSGLIDGGTLTASKLNATSTLTVTGTSSFTGLATVAYASSTGSISQTTTGTSTMYMLSSSATSGFCLELNATSTNTIVNMTFMASSTNSTAGLIPAVRYGACRQS